MARFFPLYEAVSTRRDLSMAAKAVHAVIAGFDRMQTGAFPSQETIGTALGVTGRHVRNAIHELTTAGLIERRRRGVLQSNQYALVGVEVDAVRNSSSGNSSSVRNNSSGNSSSSAVRNSSSCSSGTVLPPNRSEESLNRSDDDGTQWERIRWIQSALAGFMPEWNQPDVALCKKVDTALNGRPLDELRVFLEGLHASGRKPGTSWAWFVSVIGGEFGEGKQ